MKSKKAKKSSNKSVIIAIFTLCVALVAIFTFVPMKFGNTTYTGVWGNIGISSSLTKGLYGEYTIKGEYSHDQIVSSMAKIKKTLTEQGYQSANVLSVGDKKIRVEIGFPSGVKNEFRAVYSVLTNVSIGAFELRSASSGDNYVAVTGKDHIKEMSVKDYNGHSNLVIEFNKSGEDQFKKLCDASSTIYVYMGENLQTSFSASNVQDYSSMQLTVANYDSAKDFYYKAMYGSISINLDSSTAVINTMTSLYNNGTTEGNSVVMYELIALAVLTVIAGFAVMIIKYKLAGIFLMPIMLLNLVIAFWIFAGVSIIEINISSFIALIIGLMLLFMSSFAYLNKIEQEYKKGKTIEASYLAGTKKARPAEIISSLFLTFCFAFLAIFIRGEIASASLILAIIGLENLLTNVVLLPWFMHLYIKSSNRQGTPFGLKQSENTVMEAENEN